MVIYKAVQKKGLQQEVWLEKFVREGKRISDEKRDEKVSEMENTSEIKTMCEKQKVDYQDIVFSECMRNPDAVISVI